MRQRFTSFTDLPTYKIRKEVISRITIYLYFVLFLLEMKITIDYTC